VQRGNQIVVAFSMPELTTEGLPVRSLGGIDVRIGPAPVPFSITAWEGTARPVEAKLAEGTVETAFPAAEFYGREVAIAARLLNSRGRASDWSNVVSLRVRQPLAAPAGIQATLAEGGVRLTWQGTAGARYRIYRRDEKTFAPVATVDKPEFVDTSAAVGKTFAYRVQAVAEGAESETSDAIEVAVRDVFPPAPPAGVTAVAGVSTIELGWERSPAADTATYRVYRAEDGAALIVVAPAVSDPAYSDASVTSGRRYRYAVTAVDESGNESKPSTEVSVTAP
jgi:fibronectin type 3 domain-containing protein